MPTKPAPTRGVLLPGPGDNRRPARTADTSMGVPRTRVPYKPGRRRVHPERHPQYRRRVFGLGGGAGRVGGEIETHAAAP